MKFEHMDFETEVGEQQIGKLELVITGKSQIILRFPGPTEALRFGAFVGAGIAMGIGGYLLVVHLGMLVVKAVLG